ncbi:hypothetical protein V9J79_001551 [Vibrio alginolyticus]
MFPNLPTDNLYKFLALSGVLLFCVGNYFVLTEISKYEAMSNEQKLAITELSIKSHWLLEQSDKLEKLVGNSIAAQNGTDFEKDTTKLLIRYDDNEIKAMRKMIEDKQLEYRLEIARREHTIKIAKQLSAQIKKYNYGLIVWNLISVFISLWGFNKWYHRVQKPLDLSLGSLDEGGSS